MIRLLAHYETYCTFDHSSFDCPFDPLDIPYIEVEVFDLGCLLEIGVEVFDLGCTFEDIVEVVEAVEVVTAEAEVVALAEAAEVVAVEVVSPTLTEDLGTGPVL